MATICPSCGKRNIEGTDECENCGADLRTVDLPKPTSRIEQAVMQLPLTTLRLAQMTTITPDATLESAVRLLDDHKLDILAVIEGGTLKGLLSVRDVMTRAEADYAKKLSRPVREFMTATPETLPPDAPINFALNMMDVGGYRHVPVVQDGHLLGVVSTREVIRYLLKNARVTVTVIGKTTSHGIEPAAQVPT